MEPNGDLLSRHLRALPAFRGLLRAVEARFYTDIDLPEPVLDLGCGDGHFASEAFSRPLRAGIDPWRQPLQEAGSRHRHAYDGLAQASGAQLPFAAGQFASVVSNSVLEHIPELEPVLAEVARVLRPGGRFVFCVPSENFLSFLSVSLFLRRTGLAAPARAYERFFNRISRHYHCDSPAVWRERLARVGMEVERHWYYFSPGALRALEWGHYLGAPSLAARWLTGRWLLNSGRWNLWLTDKLLRRYFDERSVAAGAYLFFVARRPN